MTEKNEGNKIGEQQSGWSKWSEFSGYYKKHRQLCEEADKHHRLNTERMKLKYSKVKKKTVMTFSKGDFC